MIILLQSVTNQFRRLLLLQSVTSCCCKVRQVLQSVTDCHYKVRQKYYKKRQTLLQSASGIRKCNSCYKAKHNKVSSRHCILASELNHTNLN